MRACRWARPTRCAAARPRALSSCAASSRATARVDVEGVSGDITLRALGAGRTLDGDRVLQRRHRRLPGRATWSVSANTDPACGSTCARVETRCAGPRQDAVGRHRNLRSLISADRAAFRHAAAADIATMSAACASLKWVSMGLGAIARPRRARRAGDRLARRSQPLQAAHRGRGARRHRPGIHAGR